jgi:hypothetical protein
MTQQSSGKTTPEPRTIPDQPPQCDRALMAGHYVRCVLGLGHLNHHVGYSTAGDLQSTTWCQNDIRETAVEQLPDPQPLLTPQQKLGLLALALTPNPPARATR